MQIEYVKILNRFYPDVECYSTGPNYSDIVWLTEETVSQAELDVRHLQHVKDSAEERIKIEASKKRDEVYTIVLGTNDESLVRVYEEKTRQARYYLDCLANEVEPDANECFLLLNEATNLSVTPEYLANAIIFQHNHANQQIMPMIGQIEGIRRAKQFMIIAASTDNEVEALMNTPIEWPDLSELVII